MNQPEITPDVVDQHGITPDEYEKIVEILGREPNYTELGVFSVMWSEHCSYKSSRVHLKRLPTEGERVIVPPGENAGVVDIGDDWCVAFKVESHNHPSFIEPFQGAATGVGGILRDVFTMGARPIASMNSLRFGHLTDDKHGNRNKSILKGVVEGIAHYGNCFGVPTIGGEVVFDEAYNLNPLVNAFALGIVRKDQIFFGKATGVGNPVMYVGAKTGRDGIHGATMASAEFDEEALEKRPTVQVGDPFLEKLLLEACLEAMRSGAIEGIQDMGAAGLTSSSVEMADRAGTGLELDLTLVPQRESEMTAYEMLLSESQERMLIVAKQGREKELVEIFSKWELDAVVIGKVVEGNRLKIFHNGELMADLPVDKLTEAAPLYNRPMAKPEKKSVQSSGLIAKRKTLSYERQNPDCNGALRALLSSPNICSKHFVYQQYDHMVRTNTAVLPGADAAVVRIKETRRAVSMCLDGNGRFAAVNPKEGAKLTVAEAARNNVCVGGKPIAVTNCLNFASPERPKIMWAFSETIDGMKEACEIFETPVISGNVSFYNETDGDGVLPTPTIGMVGLVEDVRKILTPRFKNDGDIIALLGVTNDDLSVSEYAQTVIGFSTEELIEFGDVPKIDLTLEKSVQDACLEMIHSGIINSAHDCSDGGIAVAIAECCFSSLNNQRNGADIKLENDQLDAITQLFSESPSRILVTFSESDFTDVKRVAEKCPFEVIGRVSGDQLIIKVNGRTEIEENISDLESVWKSSLEKQLSIKVNSH